MKNRICFLWLLLCISLTLPAQLLWKISGNGLSRPSYVVGTYHLAPASFVDSIAGSRAVLEEVQQVYGELDLRSMTGADAVSKMQAALMLPEGTTFESLFTPDELSRLNAFMLDLMGADMTHPMVAQQMKNLKPAALTTQFVVLMCLKKRPGFDMNNLFDAAFQKEALAQNKTVGGLEDIDRQIQVLYSQKTLKRQAQELMCLVDNREYNETVSETLLEAFFSQDMKRIQEAMEMKLGNACDATAEEEEALVYGRNADWAGKMPEIMRDAPTLFVVGAAHLPGDRGVLALLRKAGYTVNPLAQSINVTYGENTEKEWD